MPLIRAVVVSLLLLAAFFAMQLVSAFTSEND